MGKVLVMLGMVFVLLFCAACSDAAASPQNGEITSGQQSRMEQEEKEGAAAVDRAENIIESAKSELDKLESGK